ncbi:hypothetical protein KIW84_072311 [Lathyrus oleraceus]|uniref:MADS-box domain-containing protein n=1 Tax=Pisum sativum TaxID=3888 RepID=A0A9D4ZX89_PEA|nr:hypothetical protein KIW84_072311 [Pisum sativum]
MRKIEDIDNLFVTFTKRKTGIYNKATELSTLCGAKVDILMISPTGNPFCYGEPSSKSLVRTSLKEETSSMEDLIKRQMVEKLNMKNDQLMDEIHVAKAQRETLTASNSSGWWEIKEKGRYDHKIDEHIKNITHQMINEVISQGGEIDSHDKWNGFGSDPTCRFGSNNNGSEIEAGERSNHYDPKNKGKSIMFGGASGSGTES